MSLWKFIENKLAEMGKDERWLEDECGFTGYMLPRIRSGGTIQNATKQKLAQAFKCSIGDINAAIAQIDKPKAEADEPKKVPAEKIKWYPDAEQETYADPEAYKAKLKDTLMKLTVAEDWPTSNILFEKFGRAVAKDLLE